MVMTRSEIKSHKEKLRQIENHLRLAHNDLGIERDSVGFVEVVHHLSYRLPALNYVTPRRKTALVPSKDVQKGMQALQAYRRDLRLLYIEELFPPFFAKKLEDMDLRLYSRTPLWVVDLNAPVVAPKLSGHMSVSTVHNEDGIGIWSLVWRNASYRVFGTTLEPLQIGTLYPSNDHVIDIILYNHHKPMAVARLTIHDNSAHLMARALVQSTNPLRLQQWLLEISAQTAKEQGCDLLFICDSTIEYLQAVTDLSLTQEGSMLCYTDKHNQSDGEVTHDTVEQLVLLT